MIILRLAVRLGFSRDRRQRWRQISVIGAGFVVGILALSATGFVWAAESSDQRIAARAPVLAGAGPARLAVSARGLQVPGLGQVPVVWIAPLVSPAGVASVPPGLRRLPGPGEAVLSPGLVDRGYAARDFGLHPSRAGSGPGGTIGRDGLSTRSEGWIYARPGPGRSLGSGGALLRSSGYGVPGVPISLETIPQLPSSRAAYVGVLWTLIAPGLFLLLGAARALSSVRDERAQLLWSLGVDRVRIRVLGLLETGILLTAGVLPAVLLWAGWLRHLTRLPMNSVTLLPDSMAVPLVLGALVAAGIVVAGAVAGAWGRIGSAGLRRDARRVREWQVVPLVAAFTMMLCGLWLDPRSNTRQVLLFAGLLSTFVGLPMGLPVLVARLGTVLGRSGRPAVWLAGRRLALRSANLSKPAAVVGALIFLAGSAYSLYARMAAPPEAPAAIVSAPTYDVTWRDPRPLDRAVIRNRASGAGLRVSFPPNGPVSAMRVSGDQELSQQRVMQVFAADLPAVNITQVSAPARAADPQGSWVLLGWSVATLVLCGGLIREAGERAMIAVRDAPSLALAGLRPAEIRSTYRWSLLPPIVVAIPLGALGAVIFALLGFQLGLTIDNLARILLVAGAAGLLASGTFAIVFATAGIREPSTGLRVRRRPRSAPR